MDTIWCVSFVVGLLCLANLSGVQSYPDGPPIASNYGLCMSMTPDHGPVTQGGVAPYTIDLGGRTCYKRNDTIKVTITPTDGTSFKGFLVEARMGAANSESYGVFTTSANNQQTQDCFTGSNNAISHSDGGGKSITNFYWQPLTSDAVDITFTATVVRTRRVFWTQVTSSILQYNSACTEMPAVLPNSAESVQSPALAVIVLGAVCLWKFLMM